MNQKNLQYIKIEPIRNNETEERRQCQTVIVPDTKGADGDQQEHGKEASNVLFHK